jgi:hypothetical protein
MGAPDWIDRLEAKGTRVDRAIITPRPSELVQVEPSAPAMTAEEARERLNGLESEFRAIIGSPGVRADFARDAAALALAIRALELLGEVAACDSRAVNLLEEAMVWLPRTTWDAIRALTQVPEGGA